MEHLQAIDATRFDNDACREVKKHNTSIARRRHFQFASGGICNRKKIKIEKYQPQLEDRPQIRRDG